MVTIDSKFIGDFKMGDNINHNLKVLELLYKHYSEGNDEQKRLLCKPIIILLVSIIDAVLYDLHLRIRTFTREGVRNIVESSIEYIRKLKKMDEFDKCITSAKKHALLGPPEDKLYADLDELRQLRNRVHIQNTKRHLPRNEHDAFNADKKLMAEKAVEKVLREMAARYERSDSYVDDFELPWDAHYKQ